MTRTTIAIMVILLATVSLAGTLSAQSQLRDEPAVRDGIILSAWLTRLQKNATASARGPFGV